MKFMQNSSIRRKMTAIVMLICSLALISVYLIIAIADRIQTRTDMVRDLKILSNILGANSTAAITFGIDEDAEEVLSALKAKPEVVTAHIYTIDGRLIASYYRNNDKSIDFHKYNINNQEYLFGSDHLDLMETIYLNKKPIGRMFIRQDLSELSEQLNHYMIIMSIAFIIAILIAFIAIGSLQKVISKPIIHLASVARKVYKNKNYSVRAKQFSSDECGFLTEKFNEMLSDIQQRDADLKDARDSLEIRVKERTKELESEIKEREWAEALLKESQQKLLLHIQQTPLGVIQLNLDLEVLEWNYAAEEMFKYSTDEAIGKKIIDIVVPETQRSSVSQSWMNLMTYKGATRSTDTNITKNGENILCEWYNTALVDDNGKTVGVASLVMDITEQKRAVEQEQKLLEELDKAQRMESLGILAGGVAHDLNNMLGPVVGYTELILMELKEEDKLAKRVQRISKSAKGAADVIQDLLTLARRGRYEMSPVNVNSIIKDFIESPSYLSFTESNKDIDVTITLDKNTDFILGSEAHLSKLVMNLIVNAFDAMHGSGSLSISTSSVNLKKLPNNFELGVVSGEYILFKVVDTGKGIEQEDLDKIFEPYYSKKKMGSSSGSGLGLSVVYGVIKDHKGFYDIKSVVGEGTEFLIYLPVTTEEIEVEEPKVLNNRGTESILIIDDDEGQLEVGTELLESLGYKVNTCSSGEEAIEYLESNSIDIILLDMIMDPGIDGLDTYKEIIKTHPGQKTIIVSGFSATERVEEMQHLGAGQYIRKPYNLAKIGTAIKNEFSKSKEVSS